MPIMSDSSHYFLALKYDAQNMHSDRQHSLNSEQC